MRVCIVSSELAPWSGWGVGTYAANMAAALAGSGDEVHVLTSPASDLEDGPSRLLGGAFVHTLEPASSLSHMPARAADRPIALLEALRALHEAHQFELIEFPDVYADAYHCVQARRTLGDFEGAVLAVRLHSPIFLLRDINRQRSINRETAIVEHMEMEAIRGADMLLAPSQAVIDEVRRRLGGRIQASWRDEPTPAHVARNPFDPSLLAPDHARSHANRYRTILAYGRLEYRKGFQTLVDAATRLLDDGVDIAVRIVGEDTDSWPGRRSVRARLEARIPDAWSDRFGVDRNASREDLASMVAGAEVCCFPSLWENFPYACLEAMARGAVVVASDAGGMAEIVEHERSGLLFRAGDAADLADKLRVALAGGSRRSDMQRRAPQRVAELTDPAGVARGIHALVATRRKPLELAHEEREPTVAVLIPHKDMPGTLRAAVDSALTQTRAADQIILVDDGSESGAAHALVDEIEREQGVTVVRQPNRGLAAARNAALARASTDYVVPLDADDLLDPMFVQRTLEAVAREPDLALVTTLMSCFKDDPANPEFGYAPIGLDRDTLLAFNPASSCTALIRRDAIAAVGGYDESLWAYEDWDLYARMAERDMPSALVPEHLVHNRVRKDSMLRSLDRQGEHELRAMIIAAHPGLAAHPDRAARLILSEAYTPRKPRPVAPTHAQVEAAADRKIREAGRYRLADKAAAIARKTGLTPILKMVLRP